MLFWVTRLFRDTRKAKLVPEKNVTHHHARVAASENEELRPHAEGGEGYFWEHRVFATRGVAVEEVGFVGENLNEAFMWVSGVFEEKVVSELKGVKRDAVLGEKGEVVVEGVVEEGGGEEAAGGGDEGGGGAGGWFRGDEVVEDAAGDGDVFGGVGVDVDVEEAVAVVIGGRRREELLPERGEGEIGVGEEEEGDFRGGGEVGGCVGGGGAAEEGEVVGVGRGQNMRR